ncbi:MAG: CBS domain-containing protein [Candidatus Dormibacteraeota bacterium]|jgi:CBS domain-containing protein|nr:CBS domain-containing protein [Candidatus Dormibacteraeota bacterium]
MAELDGAHPIGATVAAMMTKAVITTSPDTTVAEVASLLHRNHITGMPVVDDHQRVVGVVSEMDVVRKKGATAAEIMTATPRTVEEDVPLAEVADVLMTERIRRLPVVRHGKLVGLISRTDLVTFFAQHQWACSACGGTQRGLEPPLSCPSCGAERAFRLEEAPHGM